MKLMTVIVSTLALVGLLVALLTAPVAAEGMWNGDNWVDSNHNDVCTKVVYNVETGNTNCYNENVGSKADIAADPNTYSGRVDVIIRVHSNTLNQYMYLANNITPNIKEKIAVNSDGLNTIGPLAPGRFKLTLDRYDLEDEVAYFDIAAGQQEPTRVVFEGQGMSQPTVCTPIYTIKSATYGYGTSHEVTVQHGDYDREWINGYCARVWHGMCVDYRPAHWDYDYVGMGNGDFVRHHGCYFYVAPTQETVIDGTVIDVKDNVQQAVNSGATSLMFFNNARKPGGIFNAADELVSPIKDPAVGFVKNVVISYENGCGFSQTIQTKEYCNINLVAGSATCPST